jgi:nicotinamide phosphoribosyltransferase
MKCSAALVNGVWVDVYKDPITDKGKLSKKGRLELVHNCGIGHCGFHTVEEKYAREQDKVLRVVYENGDLLLEDTFEEIRERAAVKPETEMVSRYE